MTTDLERLQSFFDDVGQSFDVRGIDKSSNNYEGAHTLISIEAKNHCMGYDGFMTSFSFDAKGKYLGMAIWE